MPSPGNSTLSGLLIATSRSPTSRMRSSSVIGRLPGHVPRILVPPQAQESRMAKLAVVGPFRKSELADEARFDPRHALVAGRVDEWTLVDGVFVESGAEFDEKLVVVAGADLACVAQVAVVIVIADQQGAEALALAFRLSEAGDDQFLAVVAFEFQPVAGAAVTIARVGPLGDDALPAFVAGLFEERFAVLVPVGREVQRRVEAEQSPEQLLARSERQGIQIVPVDMQQIEDIEVNRDIGCTGRFRIGDLHSLLQTREAADVVLEGDRFAVDDEIGAVLLQAGLDQLGIGIVGLLAVAGQQSNLVVVAEKQQALAVELALVNPVGIGKALVGQRGQHRRHPFRVIALLQGVAFLACQCISPVAHPSFPPSSSAICFMVRSLSTDFFSVETGFRRASACSSSIFISSQRASSPEPVRCSAYPPCSFSPSSSISAWPASIAFSIGWTSSSFSVMFS